MRDNPPRIMEGEAESDQLTGRDPSADCGPRTAAGMYRPRRPVGPGVSAVHTRRSARTTATHDLIKTYSHGLEAGDLTAHRIIHDGDVRQLPTRRRRDGTRVTSRRRSVPGDNLQFGIRPSVPLLLLRRHPHRGRPHGGRALAKPQRTALASSPVPHQPDSRSASAIRRDSSRRLAHAAICRSDGPAGSPDLAGSCRARQLQPAARRRTGEAASSAHRPGPEGNLQRKALADSRAGGDRRGGTKTRRGGGWWRSGRPERSARPGPGTTSTGSGKRASKPSARHTTPDAFATSTAATRSTARSLSWRSSTSCGSRIRASLPRVPVRAGAPGRVVLGRGDQEPAGRVQRAGPASRPRTPMAIAASTARALPGTVGSHFR